VTAVRLDGKRVGLPSVAERPSLAATTQYLNIIIDVHAQNCAITRPRKYDETVRYPVLLVVDAGPQATMVVDPRDTYLMDQWYADAGFIVVRTDGRGSADRGREWTRAISTDLITIPMHDQKGALRTIAGRYPQLDVSRTGVLGEGFG